MAHPHPERLLLALLEERVPPGQVVTPAQAWDVFVAFARLDLGAPDVPDGDGLLYEYGVFPSGRRPAFTVDLVRQLAVEGDDEYDQIRLELTFAPTADLQALGTYDEWHWPTDGPTLDEWSEAVRSRPEWTVFGDTAADAVEVTRDKT